MRVGGKHVRHQHKHERGAAPTLPDTPCCTATTTNVISTYNNKPGASDDLSACRENGKHRVGVQTEVEVGADSGVSARIEAVTFCHYINAAQLPAGCVYDGVLESGEMGVTLLVGCKLARHACKLPRAEENSTATRQVSIVASGN